MPIERTSGGISRLEILDRVLDKGIVIDATGWISFVGIHLITIEAFVTVGSIANYFKHREALAQAGPTSHRVSVSRRFDDFVSFN